MKKEELDTPALCLDIEVVEANLEYMAAFFAPLPARLRPHFKTHKTPILAHMQLSAGAIGMTCAKLGEAEVLGQAGIRDILIANQIIGAAKIARLVNLAAYTEVMVAVDDVDNVAQLAAAASAKDVSLRVLIEVNVGMGRCGVTPGKAALALAQEIAARPSLCFEGMMGYEGHAVKIPDLAERRRVAEEAMASLIATRDLIEETGIPVLIVSGGGTGTYAITGRYPGVTEIQAGSYLTMDSQYHREVGMTEFGCALTLLATVIHTHGQRAIVDAGIKCLTREFGLPVVAHPAGWKAIGLSEEHGVLECVDGSDLQVGDKVEIIPSHGCTTINLHDEFHVLRRGTLEAVWPIAGRGKSA
jgi:D-serine deaminase-like pyridoxal phosphate-dependent protein